MKDIILKYNANVPRYTSYPTAPHFKETTEEQTQEWLAETPADEPVSVYLHIPFCKEMCWYCGCHTTATKKYAPVEDYVSLLLREVKMVRDVVGKTLPLSALHFGGGSPSMLSPDDFSRIMDTIGQVFDIRKDAEIAIEGDPRGMSYDRVEAYAKCGINRASLGVQDFSLDVQLAINRVQSYETVKKSVDLLRNAGIQAINFDLMYGLPLQTVAKVQESVEKALSLSPDRIAVFGYAHVPWMKKHMKLIDEASLPDASLRLDMAFAADTQLLAAGMIPVGIDHYVRTGDSMHKALLNKQLRRNFQGYTTDSATTMAGFGASAISRWPRGYLQNAAHLTAYTDHIMAKRRPVSRGVALTPDDNLRADIISDIMCYMTVDVDAVSRRHLSDPAVFDDIIADLKDMVVDGVVSVQGRTISVRDDARQIARVVAARFDTYFAASAKKHAQVA